MYLNSQDIVRYILEADDQDIQLIEGCLKLRHTTRSQERELVNMHDLYVGDHVKITNNIRPKYLQGQMGIIEKIEKDHYKVFLDNLVNTANSYRQTFNLPFSCVEKA